MELEAITKALELAPVGDRVIIETDCQACVRAFNGISKNQYVNNHFAHLREQHPNVELQLVKRKEVNIAHHLARKGAKSR
jgi:ribonuclease HI